MPSSPRFVASVGTIERREELKGIQTGFKRGGMPLKDGATLAARLMEGSDVKSATEVMTESFRGSPDERPRARVAKYLLDQLESNPDEVCLVGVDEASDEVVAIVTLSFSQAARGGADAGARGRAGSGARALPSPPDAPYLCNMAVRESARGKGVAKALLGACDELVVEMGGADEEPLNPSNLDQLMQGLDEMTRHDEAQKRQIETQSDRESRRDSDSDTESYDQEAMWRDEFSERSDENE